MNVLNSPFHHASVGRVAFSWERLLPFFIVFAGVLAYVNIFSNPFIFDDNNVILSYPNSFKLWPLSLSSRFVVNYTFKLNYLWDQYNVAGYHAVNVLIHIFSGLLLYGIIRRTLKFSLFAPEIQSSASWLAFACACIWVVHPVQTECVGYTCQRYESLMGMFMLLSLYGFARAQGSSRCRFWYDVSLGSCMLGMGTKEVMVVAPLAIMLYDHMFVSRSFHALLRQRWKFHAAMFATLGVAYVLHLDSVTVQLNTGLIIVQTGQVSPPRYLLTQFGVILHYLKLSVAPYPLCMDYAWPIAVEWREILPAAVVVVVLFLVTCRAVLARRPSGFLGAWFFLMLAPSSSLFPVADMASEHRMYLASAGVICAAVFGCYRLVGFLCGGCSERRSNLVGAVILVTVVCSLAVMTYQRNWDYRSDLTMWRDVVTKRPDNFRSYVPFLSALVKEGRAPEAERVARSALKRMEESRRWTGAKGAFITGYADFWWSGVQNELGRALLAQGKSEEAISCFKDTLSVQPGNPLVRNNLGFALYLAGKKDEALRVLEELIRSVPNFGKPRILKALILEEEGEFKAAMDLYQQVSNTDAASMWAKCELAWLMATCPDDGIRDGHRAVVLAEDVCGATLHLSVRALDVLAAAYAETGRFDDAVRAATRALKLADERKNNATVCLADGTEDMTTEPPAIEQLREIAQRLEIYKLGKPFRMERHGSSTPGANGPF